jgi:hypothetical protein
MERTYAGPDATDSRTDDRAPKNFTTHQSRLAEEGRRNQPKVASPKKMKKRHAKKHLKAQALRITAGALSPFFSESELPNTVF